ncbi:hypothetical protein EWB00_000308 [Schistosoma japonicum]|uniref:Uncharacterized protein n=1 Tax=Schistosoma japonicum TaxID=6182 RepID=A0A4Z2CKL0_SCHJA|nr:hypothetical protein EWB00_000308 [Schistosoma japonicum]
MSPPTEELAFKKLSIRRLRTTCSSDIAWAEVLIHICCYQEVKEADFSQQQQVSDDVLSACPPVANWYLKYASSMLACKALNQENMVI